MRARSDWPLHFLTLLVTVWCVALPFVWPYTLGHKVGVEYREMLGFYIPELVVGGVVLVCLPLVMLRHRLAVIGLLLAATLAPALEFTIGSPSVGGWETSVLLLSLLSWRLHVRIARGA